MFAFAQTYGISPSLSEPLNIIGEDTEILSVASECPRSLSSGLGHVKACSLTEQPLIWWTAVYSRCAIDVEIYVRAVITLNAFWEEQRKYSLKSGILDRLF